MEATSKKYSLSDFFYPKFKKQNSSSSSEEIEKTQNIAQVILPEESKKINRFIDSGGSLSAHEKSGEFEIYDCDQGLIKIKENLDKWENSIFYVSSFNWGKIERSENTIVNMSNEIKQAFNSIAEFRELLNKDDSPDLQYNYLQPRIEKLAKDVQKIESYVQYFK
jgi:hypothetical protein